MGYLTFNRAAFIYMPERRRRFCSFLSLSSFCTEKWEVSFAAFGARHLVDVDVRDTLPCQCLPILGAHAVSVTAWSLFLPRFGWSEAHFASLLPETFS